MEQESFSAVRKYLDMISKEIVYPLRSEYKLIGEIHQQYLMIRDLLDGKIGIIEPIRAMVVNPKNIKRQGDDNLIRKILEAYYHMGVDLIPYCKNVYGPEGSEDSVQDFDEWRRCTKVVGYMIGFRMENNEKYRIGTSLCVPQDYINFNKEMGIVLAYERLQLDCKSQSDENTKYMNRAVMTSPKNDTMYLFPLTVEAQIKRFEDRVRRYFQLDGEGR